MIMKKCGVKKLNINNFSKLLTLFSMSKWNELENWKSLKTKMVFTLLFTFLCKMVKYKGKLTSDGHELARTKWAPLFSLISIHRNCLYFLKG